MDHGLNGLYFPQISEAEAQKDNCNIGAEIYTSIIYHKDWIEKTSGEKILLANTSGGTKPPKDNGGSGATGGDSKTPPDDSGEGSSDSSSENNEEGC